jgi:hypothetical protein
MKTIGEFFNYTLAVKRPLFAADSLRFSQTTKQAEHSDEIARREYLQRYSLNLTANS